MKIIRKDDVTMNVHVYVYQYTDYQASDCYEAGYVAWIWGFFIFQVSL